MAVSFRHHAAFCDVSSDCSSNGIFIQKLPVSDQRVTCKCGDGIRGEVVHFSVAFESGGRRLPVARIVPDEL